MASSVGDAGLWAMTTALSATPQRMGFLGSSKLGNPRQRSNRDEEHRAERGGKERRKREGEK